MLATAVSMVCTKNWVTPNGLLNLAKFFNFFYKTIQNHRLTNPISQFLIITYIQRTCIMYICTHAILCSVDGLVHCWHLVIIVHVTFLLPTCIFDVGFLC